MRLRFGSNGPDLGLILDAIRSDAASGASRSARLDELNHVERRRIFASELAGSADPSVAEGARLYLARSSGTGTVTPAVWITLRDGFPDFITALRDLEADYQTQQATRRIIEQSQALGRGALQERDSNGDTVASLLGIGDTGAGSVESPPVLSPDIEALLQDDNSSNQEVSDALAEVVAEDEEAFSLPDVEDTDQFTVVANLPERARTSALLDATADPLVRRPTLGIIREEKDRFASLEVIVRGSETDSTVPQIELFNSSYPQGRAPISTNFFVSGINEGREEALQIVRTLGDFYVGSTGETPRVIQVSGILLEAKNFPWLSEWRRNYELYLRARQCILRRAQVFLAVGGFLYVGYVIGSSFGQNVSPMWEMAQFSFNMVLRDVIDLRVYEAGGSGTFDTFTSPNGDVFVGGIRIPDTVRSVDGGDLLLPEGDIVRQIEAAAEELALQESYGTAQALEIVQGRIDGQVELADVVLSGESPRKTLSEFRLDELLATAQAINRNMGGRFLDTDQLRRNYMLQRRAELEVLNMYDPFSPEDYGIAPLASADARAAARRRQQRHLQDLEDVVSAGASASFRVL